MRAVDIAPSRFYLSGFIVPHEADEDWKSARDGQEGVVEGDGTGDDEAAKNKASARKVFFPSSIGMSVCVGAKTKTIQVTATWGDYERVGDKKDEGEDEAGVWQRTPRKVELSVPVATGHHQVAPNVKLKKPAPIEYVLFHSLPHLLLTQLSLECGYRRA